MTIAAQPGQATSAIVSVSDTGVGIEKRAIQIEAEKAFESFARQLRQLAGDLDDEPSPLSNNISPEEA